MFKRLAYKIVYKDLTRDKGSIFCGHYDAKNGSKEFMYGVSTVVETIAHEAGGYNKTLEYTLEFAKNMTESEEKA